MTEVWMPLTEFPEYSVSNLGRIKRVKGGRGTRANYILRQRVNMDGYPCVTVQRLRTHRKSYLVNRLVCEAVHGPAPTDAHHAAHGDGVRTNNHADNLRWATRQENEADKDVHGTRSRGEGHAGSKLTELQVAAIRTDKRPQSQIAKDHGVSQSLICMVRTKKVWAHV